MKLFRLGILLFLLLLVTATGAVFAQTFPAPQGYVNDFAELLSVQTRTQIEDQLSLLEKDTTAQVSLVTVESLEGNTIEDYSSRLFESWGIGKKVTDNGVLFIIAKEEQKVRIEVGYGLEGVITDGRAGRILDEDVLPYFKKSDYEKGITGGVKSIEKYVRSGTPPEPLEENPVRSMMGGFSSAFIIVTVVGAYLTGFMARSKNIWLGTIFGAVAGTVLGLVLGGLTAVIILAIISAGIGAGLDFLLSSTYRARKAAGKSTSWNRTWGGFGGGSSGGGFGGFGGGMSGGGGASRGW